MDAVEQLARLAVHGLPVDLPAGLGRLTAHEDVLRNREVFQLIQLLKDDADTAFALFFNAARHDLLALVDNLALVVGVDTGKHLHNGRLACAVLTEQNVNFARLCVKTNMIQCQNAWELHCDIVHFY